MVVITEASMASTLMSFIVGWELNHRAGLRVSKNVNEWQKWVCGINIQVLGFTCFRMSTPKGVVILYLYFLASFQVLFYVPVLSSIVLLGVVCDSNKIPLIFHVTTLKTPTNRSSVRQLQVFRVKCHSIIWRNEWLFVAESMLVGIEYPQIKQIHRFTDSSSRLTPQLRHVNVHVFRIKDLPRKHLNPRWPEEYMTQLIAIVRRLSKSGTWLHTRNLPLPWQNSNMIMSIMAQNGG